MSWNFAFRLTDKECDVSICIREFYFVFVSYNMFVTQKEVVDTAVHNFKLFRIVLLLSQSVCYNCNYFSGLNRNL